MFQRVAYGIVAIGLIVLVVVGDAAIAHFYPVGYPLRDLLVRGSVIPLVLTAAALGASVELRALLASRGFQAHARIAYVVIALLVLSPWLSAGGLLGDRPAEQEGFYWQIVWLGGGVLATMLAEVIRGVPSGCAGRVGATGLMIGYLGLLPSFGTQLRCSPYFVGSDGAFLILAVVLITKASDIGGYLVGSQIGRHKLIPSISPGKSVEGTVGGVAFSTLVAVFAVTLGHLVDLTTELANQTGWLPGWLGSDGFLPAAPGLYTSLGFGRAAILGAALAVVALMGDLFESCLKRDANLKDSANHIPGYGGILDLMDSPCAALPVAWFLLSQVWCVI